MNIKRVVGALFGQSTKREIEEALRKELEEAKGQVKDYQTLTENLRDRLAQAESDHRQEVTDLHNCYKQQVESLSEKLLLANNAIGMECRSKTMLEQTNNALSDLCQAIAFDSIEDIAFVTQRLEWSNPLTVIAQHYINVLKRKNELENHHRKDQDNYNFD